MSEHGLLGKKLPLGFTFSFPCKQEGLAVGRLVRWTKGFRCDGVEGEDVVKLLHDAIKRKVCYKIIMILVVVVIFIIAIIITLLLLLLYHIYIHFPHYNMVRSA